MNEDKKKKMDGSGIDWIDHIDVERFEIQEGLLLFVQALGRVL